MADFNFVTVRLAAGAAIGSPKDVQALIAAGVTHIIDCRADFDDASLLASRPELHYLWNGVNDDGQPKPASWFEKSISFALSAFVANPHYRVYAHCQAGVNRGPSTCYAILRALGLNTALAENLIRTARPQVQLRYKPDADAAVHLLGYV